MPDIIMMEGKTDDYFDTFFDWSPSSSSSSICLVCIINSEGERRQQRKNVSLFILSTLSHLHLSYFKMLHYMHLLKYTYTKIYLNAVWPLKVLGKQYFPNSSPLVSQRLLRLMLHSWQKSYCTVSCGCSP